jgi:hypothetical protein
VDAAAGQLGAYLGVHDGGLLAQVAGRFERPVTRHRGDDAGRCLGEVVETADEECSGVVATVPWHASLQSRWRGMTSLGLTAGRRLHLGRDPRPTRLANDGADRRIAVAGGALEDPLKGRFCADAEEGGTSHVATPWQPDPTD